MTARVAAATGRRSALGLAAILAVALVPGCGPDDGAQTVAPSDEVRTTTTSPPSRDGVEAAVSSSETAPDADLFLPPLPEHRVDDDVDVAEERESLAHSDVRVADLRRRLVLGEDGSTTGRITVVTLEPGHGGADQVLSHRFGGAPTTATDVSGVGMVRVAAQPHGVLAWTGPNFVVIFERGQEMTEEWLEGLARATIAAMREQVRR
ncbi:MAG TPA: hypothetical protein VM263_01110 [Acidimicrobiales bacterium]|nr:hypothetical protein [Acidimicrobiales bacterium]